MQQPDLSFLQSYIGQILGNYRLVKCLGAGGVGAVFLGEYPRIESQVAIKILLPRFISNEDMLRRFLDEARAVNRINHPEYLTGIPQFWADWTVAPQIKFDVIWGWDRFEEGGEKPNAGDNTSYGHNVEFVWLFLHALDVMKADAAPYEDKLKRILQHTLNDGIDNEYGGVYVEGSHAGGVYDQEKEFWQQAEVMIGMLEASLRFGPEKYYPVYENVHRFVVDKMTNHPVGEWWPLLTREGEPIWTHMSTSWKVNYHSVRAHIQCIERLNKLADKL